MERRGEEREREEPLSERRGECGRVKGRDEGVRMGMVMGGVQHGVGRHDRGVGVARKA